MHSSLCTAKGQLVYMHILYIKIISATYIRDNISQSWVADSEPTTRGYPVCLVLELLGTVFIKVPETVVYVNSNDPLPYIHNWMVYSTVWCGFGQKHALSMTFSVKSIKYMHAHKIPSRILPYCVKQMSQLTYTDFLRMSE